MIVIDQQKELKVHHEHIGIYQSMNLYFFVYSSMFHLSNAIFDNRNFVHWSLALFIKRLWLNGQVNFVDA